MKRFGLLGVMLLAGCVPTQKEYTIIRETSRPATVQAEEKAEVKAVETQTVAAATPAAQVSVVEPSVATPCQQMTANGQPACAQPAPTYFAGTYNKPQGIYQTQQHISYQSGGCGGQVMCGQNLASTLGGTVMNMPAQTMMTSAMPVQMPVQAMIPQVMTMPMNNQFVQTEMIYETQTLPMNVANIPMPTVTQPAAMGDMSAVVILQHPVNRDLVKCSQGDVNCLVAYEAQGYVQLRNMTTTYGNAASQVNYAISGTWQDNNIPRW